MLLHRRQARPKNLLPLAKERAVEQCLAFGRSDEWIIRELRGTQAQVDDVRLWLDEVNAAPDEVPQPSLAAAQRAARRQASGYIGALEPASDSVSVDA